MGVELVVGEKYWVNLEYIVWFWQIPDFFEICIGDTSSSLQIARIYTIHDYWVPPVQSQYFLREQ